VATLINGILPFDNPTLLGQLRRVSTAPIAVSERDRRPNDFYCSGAPTVAGDFVSLDADDLRHTSIGDIGRHGGVEESGTRSHAASKPPLAAITPIGCQNVPVAAPSNDPLSVWSDRKLSSGSDYWRLGDALDARLRSASQTQLARETGVSQATISRAQSIRSPFGSAEEAEAAYRESGCSSIHTFSAWCRELTPASDSSAPDAAASESAVGWSRFAIPRPESLRRLADTLDSAEMLTPAQAAEVSGVLRWVALIDESRRPMG